MHTQAIKGYIGLVIKGLNYTVLYYKLYLIYHTHNYFSTIKTDLIIYF